ncbi:MAG TPA: pilus assembly protein PilP [Dissulfurispiraceae bacterium]
MELPKIELPSELKKRLPLILAVVGVFVIGAIGAFVYTTYFAGSPAEKTPPVQAKAQQAPKALPQQQQQQTKPQPQPQKSPQQAGPAAPAPVSSPAPAKPAAPAAPDKGAAAGSPKKDAQPPQPGKPQENKKPEAAPPVAAQDVADKAKTAVAYEYNPKGRRDPFAALIVKAAPEKKRGLTPMENVETADVRLIAILWNKSGYYAVITLPDGKSYTIREGVKLGLNGGSVYKITKNSVIIREQARDERGRISRKDITLKLRREEEG